MRVWVTGAQGMLGAELVSQLAAAGIAHAATDRDVDITDYEAVQRFGAEHTFDWIVNCAAYTAVDRAEADEAKAYTLNAEGAFNLAAAAQQSGARILQVSTDYVFGGNEPGPFDELAPHAPVNAYGRTKALGERFVLEQCEKSVVLRTAWLHAPGRPCFVETMLRHMRAGQSLQVVSDQRGAPTYVGHLAQAMIALLQPACDAHGTYHFTNVGTCTWYDFAVEIQKQALAAGLLERETSLVPIPTEAYPTAAKRPANSVLVQRRTVPAWGEDVPTWQEGLTAHLAALVGAPA